MNVVASFPASLTAHTQTMFKEATMNRSLFTVPAMVCMAAALVTAQAPADRPNPPATENASGAAARDAAADNSAHARAAPASPSIGREQGHLHRLPQAGNGSRIRGFWRMLKSRKSPERRPGRGRNVRHVEDDVQSRSRCDRQPDSRTPITRSSSSACVGRKGRRRRERQQRRSRQQFSVESLKMVSATCP